MTIELLRSLAWTDYRLSLLFVVLAPLGLLIWSIAKKAKPITNLLVIYWRVASLLLIAVYLMMAELPFSFIVRFCGLLLVLISLWFWADLNEEIADQRGELKLAFGAWRWAMTFYCGIAAIGQLPFLKCALSKEAISDSMCQVWIQAPWGYKALLHGGTNAGKLGFIAMIALVLYCLYFIYFLLFRLAKQGRSATGF
ncbi:MAG: DUF3177 family protein [Cyanobacteria bacterium P01_A01_bin.17]